ncbi:hypothetical protein BIY21_20130 [Vibrio ponticus]|uniref:Outer membrane protein beta-barrel domain-containing protein n=1 Tax=Vibrio ponticus TaxID=265668 RepID=A0A3N3E3J3_9VIBR|nr:hypothetical protein [Vibrio ponticus]OLQ84398.1 hypothetical protein BIY21_20130 [Vibrio ponticus]ROV61098.1 hypothetical protein EGH82_06370 [Vibrio ponticus]
MKKTILLMCLMASSNALATGLHISPDMKIGPYFGSGISGGGLQLGVTDTAGLDAIYLSYSHTSAEILTDKDRLKTYRLGAQYNLPQVPMLGFQLEIGGVKYEGSRYYFWNKPTEYREGSGVSMAAAWVLAVNDNLALRAGMDVNYIDSDKTYLSSNFSTTLNTGIVLRF